MRHLFIVGAGGLGRMVLSWLSDVPQRSRDWTISGFLDDQPHALDGYACGASVVAGTRDYKPSEDDRFVMAIGHPGPKMEAARQITAKGGTFVTIVHPSAIIGERVVLGPGTVVGPYAVITNDANIGEFVLINVLATIGHDVSIGAGCTLSSHSDVMGGARLGQEVFLGSHASILPGAYVEDSALVGAGSVVLKHVKRGATVYGVPAKPL